MKLGPQYNYHKGRAAIRHYANQTARLAFSVITNLRIKLLEAQVSSVRDKAQNWAVCMMQVQPDQTLCYALQLYFTTYCFYCFLMKWTAHLITSIVYS